MLQLSFQYYLLYSLLICAWNPSLHDIASLLETQDIYQNRIPNFWKNIIFFKITATQKLVQHSSVSLILWANCTKFTKMFPSLHCRLLESQTADPLQMYLCRTIHLILSCSRRISRNVDLI